MHIEFIKTHKTTSKENFWKMHTPITYVHAQIWFDSGGKNTKIIFLNFYRSLKTITFFTGAPFLPHKHILFYLNSPSGIEVLTVETNDDRDSVNVILL